LLGYAIGHTEDIHAYYDDLKAYGLKLEPVDPVIIPTGYAAKRAVLVKRRDELEAELKELNRKLDAR